MLLNTDKNLSLKLGLSAKNKLKKIKKKMKTIT